MRESFAHGVGGVLSADIAVPDHERELGFYAKILTSGQAPLWREDLANNQGTPIIGLGVRTAEYDALPLQWMPHFQVADVANSVVRAIDLGGAELMRDVENQWAVLVDQFGAAFGVIPVVADESNSTDTGERIGCIAWLTLNVPDASASRDFYQQVVGWDATPSETEDSDASFPRFEMRRGDGIAAAEICDHRSEDKGLPPVWLISLPVDDMTESLRYVRENGGEIIKANADATHAIIRDPVGAYIALQAGQENATARRQ